MIEGENKSVKQLICLKPKPHIDTIISLNICKTEFFYKVIYLILASKCLPFRGAFFTIIHANRLKPILTV